MRSWKCAEERLKPAVPAFARLFEITLNSFEAAERPVRDVFIMGS
jgi:hypothetical protein